MALTFKVKFNLKSCLVCLEGQSPPFMKGDGTHLQCIYYLMLYTEAAKDISAFDVVLLLEWSVRWCYIVISWQFKVTLASYHEMRIVKQCNIVYTETLGPTKARISADTLLTLSDWIYQSVTREYGPVMNDVYNLYGRQNLGKGKYSCCRYNAARFNMILCMSKVWTHNRHQVELWAVICCLTKPPLNLGHGWIITPLNNVCDYLSMPIVPVTKY